MHNNANTSHRWFSKWRAARRRVRSEPADMGTAFGLDASFADDTDEQAPPPVAPKPGLMKRLSVRGKRRA